MVVFVAIQESVVLMMAPLSRPAWPHASKFFAWLFFRHSSCHSNLAARVEDQKLHRVLAEEWLDVNGDPPPDFS